MTTDDKIKDEKLECDINREGVKVSALSSHHLEKLLSMNILDVKKCYLLIKEKYYNKLNLRILI